MKPDPPVSTTSADPAPRLDGSARGGVAPSLLFLVPGLLASALSLALAGSPAGTALFGGIAFGTAVAIVVGVRLYRPADPRPWWCFAAGIVCFGVGDLLFGAGGVVNGGADPSWADALYLAGYPFLAAALLLLLRARGARRDVASLIDAAVIAVGAGALAWVFLIDPYADDRALTLPTKLVAIAYPVADLALLAIAAHVALAGGWRAAAARRIGLAIAALLAADVLYGLARVGGTFRSGGVEDALWLLSYLALGAAALHPSMVDLAAPAPAPPDRLTPGRVALLVAAVLVGPALLFVQDIGLRSVDDLVVAAATLLASLLVIARVGGLGSRLERTAAQYRALVEQTPAVVYIHGLDEATSITYVSPRVRQILGYDPEQIRAEPGFLARRIHPDDAERVWAEDERAGRAGDPFSAEYRLRAADGRWVWVRDEAVLVRDRDGHPLHWQGVLVDVSDRKAAEEAMRRAKEAAEAADRSKSRFLSTVAHEFRTPLTSIAGYVDLLLGDAAGGLNAEQREFLQTIQASAGRLVRLVNDLLDLARIEAGGAELAIRPVDVAGAVAEVVGAVAPQAAAKGIAVALEIPPDLPLVAADPDRLDQVLLNLVGNAVKFTERGGVAVSARADGGWVEVAVADTGIGIEPEALPHVFEEFSPATRASGRRFGGTGLGLAIAKQLVELHGGSIAAESAPGRGSTFTVRLPRAE